MAEKKFYELEGDAPGLVWLAQYSNINPEAYCKRHRLKLVFDDYHTLICPDDREEFRLRFDYEEEDADLARQKIFRNGVKELDIVRIDPEGYQVLAREQNRKNPNYWIDAKLSNTSRGLQLMVQVGKKDATGEKVQLFVEPAARRIDFDRNGHDIHPTGIFAKVTAEFKDSQSTISSKESEEQV
jgi:hypothetical protein